MNKIMNIRAFLVLAIVGAVGTMIGCSEKGPGGSSTQNDGKLIINIQGSPAEVMGLTQFYVLTVSAPDMEIVADTVRNVQTGLLVFDVQVPIGERRLFVLEGIQGGITSAPQVIYRGQTVAPVRPGAITTLNLDLRPIVPMVRLSPITTILAPGQPLKLQLEVYNLVDLASISIDFRWPSELLGGDVTAVLSSTQGPDVTFSEGHEGNWMGLTVANRLGGTIVNEQGNGILANITLQPLIHVFSEIETIPFGIFEIDTVWSYSILGEIDGPGRIFLEHSEVRLQTVPDREVQFADKVLLDQVRQAISVPAPTPIMLSNVLPLTYFSVIDINGTILNLSGVENMANLSTLRVSYHPIEDLSPLASLTRLTSLDAESVATNSLTPLAGMTGMRYLRLSANQITDISALLGMTMLYTLELNFNQITNIAPLTNMKDVEYLYLGDNTITDISVLAGLPNLWRLGLSNNQISDIQPLVDNDGLGSGDVIELWGNTALIGNTVQQELMRVLRDRGVTVYDTQPVK